MSIPLKDIDKAEAWSGLLPEGSYVMRVTDASEGKSKGGHDQIILDMEVIAGDKTGATCKDWIVVNENTAGRVKQVLDALDYQIPAGEFELKVSELIGRPAMVTVRHREWDGQMRTNIAAYNAAPDGVESGRPDSGAAKRDEDIPF